MVNSYYTNNTYFDEIIIEYLDNDKRGWVRHERPTDKTTLVDMDYDYYLDGQMPVCKVMSQMEGLGILGNKRQQYELMEREKPESIGTYIPKTYPFTLKTLDSLKPLFTGKKYIVKPENGRGQVGICILKDMEECAKNLRRHVGLPDCGNEWILQEYLAVSYTHLTLPTKRKV